MAPAFLPRLLLATLALGLTTSHVRAHGGVPLPTVPLPLGDGSDPVVATTFGVLIPTGGPGYRWVCEEVAGGADNTMVRWVRTSEGTVIGASAEGIFRLSPSLCGVGQPTGEAADGYIVAIAAHATRPIVVVGTAQGGIHVSEDDGESFAPRGTLDDATLGSLLVDGDSGEPRVVALWRLDDASVQLEVRQGETRTVATVSDDGAPLWQLLAHDPARPGEVYVVENGTDENFKPQDRLLRVRLVDGVVTEVIHEAADELTLAVSDDGQRVAYGGILSAESGGARITPLTVSVDQGETWEVRDTLKQVRGLRLGPGARMLATANNWQDGFAAAVSDDDGRTWQGLGRFVDIEGVHACPDEGPGCVPGADGCVSRGNDVVAMCAAYWPALRYQFGIGRDAGVPDAATDPGSRPEDGCPAPGLPSLGMVFFAGMALRRFGRR